MRPANTKAKVLNNYIIDPAHCWIYQGSQGVSNKAAATIKGERVLVQRIVWEHTHKEKLPLKQRVAALCNNGMCINPKHIVLEYSTEHKQAVKNRKIKKYCNNYKVDFQTSCWNYQGNIDKYGYGRVTIWDKFIKIHRLSWEFHNKQKIPTKKIVRHICDNTNCINPDHLLLGTHKDNTRDKMKRGRHIKGVINYNAKITEQDVYAIRASNKTLKELSKEFNLAPSTLSQIRSHQRWKHKK